MKVIAATKNKGKIREMQEILAPLDIEIVSQQELEIDVDVEETGDTFVKNALIKARGGCYGLRLSYPCGRIRAYVLRHLAVHRVSEVQDMPVTMQRMRTELTNF